MRKKIEKIRSFVEYSEEYKEMFLRGFFDSEGWHINGRQYKPRITIIPYEDAGRSKHRNEETTSQKQEGNYP